MPKDQGVDIVLKDLRLGFKTKEASVKTQKGEKT
jgi:hypothetical protein